MKYPKPYRPAGRKQYYFWCTDRQARRRMQSTGCERAGDAYDEVRKFIDNLKQAGSSTTFAEYARPYFIWKSCPRVARRLDEGKQIGF